MNKRTNNAPPWFALAILKGIRILNDLGLPFRPGDADAVKACADAWTLCLWPGTRWEFNRDVVRLEVAFRTMGTAARDDFPTPGELRRQLGNPDYSAPEMRLALPAPEPFRELTKEESRRAYQNIMAGLKKRAAGQPVDFAGIAKTAKMG